MKINSIKKLVALIFILLFCSLSIGWKCNNNNAETSGSDDQVLSPDAPDSLQAMPVSFSRIHLTWQDNSDNEDGFKIERAPDIDGILGNFEKIATVLTDTTSYNDTGLSPGTAYNYRVYAYNSAGNSGFSNVANAITNEDVHTEAINIDHNCTVIEDIPESAIMQAKYDLHIAYGHTSHGQQLIEGMRDLDGFMTGKGYEGGTYAVDFDGNGNDDYDVLDFHNRPWGLHNGTAYDLGRGPEGTSYVDWIYTTRQYLGWDCASGDGSELSHYATGTPKYNPDACNSCNVVIWSWCGQVSYCSDEVIEDYLQNMSQLEEDYPQVRFVYMTGHVDGSGLDGTLHRHNEMIRDYCIDNNKILYDFADIESYDPDGNYYGDRYVEDSCNYDYNGNGTTEQENEADNEWWPPDPINGDRNWAVDWQDSHTLGVDWYECKLRYYHTQHLNDNLKAYAAWWLWARIAGWDGQ